MLHTLLDLFGVALFCACYTYALASEAAQAADHDDPAGSIGEPIVFEG